MVHAPFDTNSVSPSNYGSPQIGGGDYAYFTGYSHIEDSIKLDMDSIKLGIHSRCELLISAELIAEALLIIVSHAIV